MVYKNVQINWRSLREIAILTKDAVDLRCNKTVKEICGTLKEIECFRWYVQQSQLCTSP